MNPFAYLINEIRYQLARPARQARVKRRLRDAMLDAMIPVQKPLFTAADLEALAMLRAYEATL